MLAAAAARAQAQTNVPRLGYLWLGPAGSDAPAANGLQQGLKELGYTEGRTVAIQRRYADGRPDRLPGLIKDLLAMPVDIVLCAGAAVARAVKNATTTVPVICTTGDPVGAGLVASLAHPGGNITGLTLGSSAQLATKWVELLKETVPALTRAVALYNPTSPFGRTESTAIMNTMRGLGIAGSMVGAASADQLNGALAAVATARPRGLIVADDPLFVAERQRVVAFAAAQRLPAVYGLGEFVDAGGLMSYAASVFDIWRQVARYADRILKGAKPADMPVEEPTKFELRLNRKAATALGLAIPHGVLLRADQVIE